MLLRQGFVVQGNWTGHCCAAWRWRHGHGESWLQSIGSQVAVGRCVVYLIEPQLSMRVKATLCCAYGAWSKLQANRLTRDTTTTQTQTQCLDLSLQGAPSPVILQMNFQETLKHTRSGLDVYFSCRKTRSDTYLAWLHSFMYIQHGCGKNFEVI